MGELDQYAKSIFVEETGLITGGVASFSVPPEIRLHEVRADALLKSRDPPALSHLPAPWCLVEEDENVIELKMQGDKLDRRCFDRALLRRQAREVERREETKGQWKAELPLWLIAPHLPRWLDRVRALTLVGEGVYRIEPYPFQFLWIASNRLPLKPELIPFLLARKDNRLLEFARWVIDHRDLDWLGQMIEVLPMTPTEMEEMFKYISETDDPKRLRKRKFIAQKLYEIHPGWFDEVEEKIEEKVRERVKLKVREEVKTEVREEVKTEVREEVQLEALQGFYELRLGHSLSIGEKSALIERRRALGVERLGKVVLESSAEELAAWLADPEAR